MRAAVRAVLLLTAAASSLHAAEPASAPVERELRRLSQALVDAIAPGDVAVWQRYAHEQFVHMDENGIVRNKSELIKELTPLPAGLVGRIELDRFQATVHGRTAVAAYEMQEYLDYHGQQLRSRFRAMDTWLETPEGWRLVAQHLAAVLKDPPSIRLSRAELCAYEGVYLLTPTVETTLRCEDAGLLSERADRPPARYVAEMKDVFFVSGKPRTRRIFTRDASGLVDGFVDRREGEDIRWRRRTGPPPSASIEDTIRALDSRYQQAVLRRDLAEMDRILADDFTLVTGKGKVHTKADVMRDEASPDLIYERQEPSQQAVRAFGNTAVVTALLYAKGTRNGKPFEYRLWYSDTYVLRPEGWRYVFAQAAQPLTP